MEFPFKFKDGMGVRDLEMLLNLLFRMGSIDLLFPAQYLDLVILAEDVEEGLILKLPGSEPGQVYIRQHGGVIEDRLTVYEPQAFEVNTPDFSFKLGDLKTESMIPGADGWFYNDSGLQILLPDGRGGPGKRKNANARGFSLDYTSQSLLLKDIPFMHKFVKSLAYCRTGHVVNRTQLVLRGEEVADFVYTFFNPPP